MRVLIATAQIPFFRRHTDDLAVDLRRALEVAGHRAEILRVPFSWNAPGGLVNQLLTCRLIDLSPDEHFRSDLVIALELPAYLIRHPNKVLWLTHHHWTGEPAMARRNGDAEQDAARREACGAVDREALAKARRIWTISATASYQLRRLCDLDALSICPPPRRPESYCWERPEGYFWIPDRLGADRWQLLLAAVAHCEQPVRIRLGSPHHEPRPDAELWSMVERWDLEEQIEWVGGLSEAQARDAYARSLAVVCPARDETFPWPAFRAMLSSKALVTCYDSGAPAEIVDHEENGLLVAARPGELAAALDALWKHPDRARAMGGSGRSWIESQSFEWPRVLESLLS